MNTVTIRDFSLKVAIFIIIPEITKIASKQLRTFDVKLALQHRNEHSLYVSDNPAKNLNVGPPFALNFGGALMYEMDPNKVQTNIY